MAPGLEADWPRDDEPRPVGVRLHRPDQLPVPRASTARRTRSSASSAASGSPQHWAAELVVFEGSGHLLDAREPVRFNLTAARLRRLGAATAADRRARGPGPRHAGRRALYLSSPIGLGHALRDVAIAGELRALRPDLEIDWLAQHPVTTVLLPKRGEKVHPASAWLASESAHIEGESAEHDLHCFQAWRDMDEILVANFHVLQDVRRRRPLRPGRRRRGLGRRLLLAREPRAQAVTPSRGSPTSSAGCRCRRR